MPAHKKSENFQTLNQRKLRILDLLAFKGELTTENKMKILTANELSSLEEFYDFYSSSYQTRGLIAIKKGLDPLANILWRQERNVVPQDDALAFIDAAYQVNSRNEALAGARDIVAERIRDNKEIKKELKDLLKLHGSLNLGNGSILPLTTKRHDSLRILEAESKGILSLSISISQEKTLSFLERLIIKNDKAASQQVRMAMEDSYQRFLLPYLEMEIRTQLLEDACHRNNRTLLTKSFLIMLLLPLVLLAFGFIFQPKPAGIAKKYSPNNQTVFWAPYKNGLLEQEYDSQGRLEHQVYYHNNMPE